MKVEEAAQRYVVRHYGNLLRISEPTFDNASKTWMMELQSDYPYVIKDDSITDRRLLKFLTLRKLGTLRFNEQLKIVEAISPNQCLTNINTLLRGWETRAEEIVVKAASTQIARIGKVKEALNPIVMVLRRLLDPEVEMVSIADIGRERNPRRTTMYLNLLEQLGFVKKEKSGYAYGDLFTTLRNRHKDDDEFITTVLAYILREQYPTIRDVFNISRFETYIDLSNCYYIPSLVAEEMLKVTMNSLWDKYYTWNRRTMSLMRMSHILDELIDVGALDHDGHYYTGRPKLFREMLEMKRDISDELSPASLNVIPR